MSSDVLSVKFVQEFARRNRIPFEFRLEKEFQRNENRIFTVRLRLDEKFYFGTDRTLKSAQRAAAQLALSDRILPSAVQMLNQWSNRNFQRIRFVFLREKFVDRPMFFYRVYLRSELFFDGHGYSHHQARSHCALNALFYLRQNPTKSNVSLMYEKAKQLGFQVRTEWTDASTVTYRIGDDFQSIGRGFDRKTAKQNGAEQMLKVLPKEIRSIVVLPPPPVKGLLKNDKSTNEREKKHVHFDEKIIEKDEQMSKRSTNFLSSTTILDQLAETCRRLKVEIHYEDERNENDQSGSSRFYSIVRLSKNDQILAQFRGQGPSISRAQENASSAAWNRLKQLFHRVQHCV